MRPRRIGGPATICLWALACTLPAAFGCKVEPCKSERCKRVTFIPDAAVDLLMTDSSIRTVAQPDAACAAQSIRAVPGKRRPVDVIFVIDNSGSMSEEIAAVRHNIDRDFAAIIEDSGVDYRVIMLSLFGEGGTGVCIDPPLGGADCSKGIEATNGARYFHYNQEIGSNDAFCQILDTLDRGQARAPHGFQDWLREDAAKAFVVITDDSARCSYTDDQNQIVIGADGADPFEDALTFHAALRAKSPKFFGGRYQFFSFVGLASSAAEPKPLLPYEPLDPTTCSTAPSPGLSYQALSIATDALRYPVCEGRSFDAVFQVLARSVIQTASAECTFELPTAPKSQVLDLGSVNLEVQTDPSEAAQRFDQVKDSSECKNDHAFYIHDRIELCPNACRVVQRASEPVVNILYGCGFELN
jgi:hypothetical protein